MWEKKDSSTPQTRPAMDPPRSQADAPHAPQPGPGARGRAANIGGSLFIKGEVTGSEDLTVEGRVEGKIDLKDHNLAIAQNGRVSAEIHAKTVTVLGEVNGDIHADEKAEIAETGRMVGDLYAPRVAISDGAQFQGSVDMGRAPKVGVQNASRESVKQQVAARGGSGRPEAQVAAQAKGNGRD
jgi:cytoskeletal protein CcmA (bactofilin family)